MKIIAALLLSCLFLFGCASYSKLRNDNRTNIQKIRVGYDQAQVSEIMGTVHAGEITNPYKAESIKVAGSTYEIWYYYTEFIGDEYWEKGMTPVVFSNGKVEAVGWRGMEQLGIDSSSSFTIRAR